MACHAAPYRQARSRDPLVVTVEQNGMAVLDGAYSKNFHVVAGLGVTSLTIRLDRVAAEREGRVAVVTDHPVTVDWSLEIDDARTLLAGAASSLPGSTVFDFYATPTELFVAN